MVRRCRPASARRQRSCASLQHDDLAADLCEGERTQERVALDRAQQPWLTEQPALEARAERVLRPTEVERRIELREARQTPERAQIGEAEPVYRRPLGVIRDPRLVVQVPKDIRLLDQTRIPVEERDVV